MPKSGTEPLMVQYCIYDHPRDYPEHYVVRRWEVREGMDAPVLSLDVVLASTVDEAREAIPPGFACIGRFTNDDPVIAEVWI